MIFSETNKEISAALSKAWGELKNPKHNKTVNVKTKNGKNYTFDYTDLGGIFDEVKNTFKENGISILQNAYTEVVEGTGLILAVETMLLHSSGEWVKSRPLKMPSSQNMQDMGGQVTYMKRYSLSAMLGIATESDDDANGVSGNTYQLSDKKATDKQLDFINNLLESSATEKYSKSDLYEHLKQKMNTTIDMEDWTAQQASRAIKILQGNKTAKQRA